MFLCMKKDFWKLIGTLSWIVVAINLALLVIPVAVGYGTLRVARPIAIVHILLIVLGIFALRYVSQKLKH